VLTNVAYGGDVTYGIGTTLIWAIAQISTGIIVACCPYLRPLFEKLLPKRLTQVSKSKSKPELHCQQVPLKSPLHDKRKDSQQASQPTPPRARGDSITVTTTIEVRASSPSPSIAAKPPSTYRGLWIPQYDVECAPAHEVSETPRGCLGRCTCC
jgi:hypothetical protein